MPPLLKRVMGWRGRRSGALPLCCRDPATLQPLGVPPSLAGELACRIAAVAW